ncbi:GNAT family N-acetyltransferase [Leptospira kanakyensis]|uniref:GNAT family N-acetyltransferase n=1 Tax=Leptospira kanakyensis TaxID=2484968 RepID=UPI00223D92E4|nr:GNAT family N-acetyltransferase [Leptospira kanakyensis]MCW7471396.1 GNAT family N-acetyltransferase [Leptospira kanakyensis]
MKELRKNIFLQGNYIYLRALTESDLRGNYQFWLNDEEIIKYNSHGRFPYTLDQLKSYISSSIISNTNLILAVVAKDSDTHIGNISLNAINWIDRNAEIAFLLGERNYWGKGIMEEAGHLLIEHAFKSLNLHRIHCGTSSENLGMQKLALKLGMKEEGIRKEAIYKVGKYFDIFEYGMINPNEIL